jgi:hypothetical protein
VFLGLVTQRPVEIDPNIISQCSTMFVMRLSNDRDQALVRSAISDAGASMLTFVPSLGTGEVFAFGTGVPLPTRMRFREVPVALRPTSEAGGNTRVAARSTKMAASSDRGATTSRKPCRRRATKCRDTKPRRRPSRPCSRPHSHRPQRLYRPSSSRQRRHRNGPASCDGR